MIEDISLIFRKGHLNKFDNQQIPGLDKFEYNILKYIYNQNEYIIPKIYFLTKDELISEKYDGDLEYFYENFSIYKNYIFINDINKYIKIKLTNLINLLYDIDIFHGDLHPHNIVFKVISRDNIDIRLIDFETSFIISEDFEEILDSLDNKNIKTKHDIKLYEYNYLLEDLKILQEEYN